MSSATSRTSNAAAIQAIATQHVAYAYDPIGWVLQAFPWGVPGTELEDEHGPREWQAEILTDIRDGSLDWSEATQIAVASGHGIGKSTLVSWIALHQMATKPLTKGIITAETETQLRTKTWVEVSKWFHLSNLDVIFRLTDSKMVSRDPKYERTWRCDIIPWSEHKTQAFAGLHNKNNRLFLLFDEASEIADRIWEVAEGALTDENTEILWSAFGNPTQPSGRFFDCFNARRGSWINRQIDSRTVPGTNLQQIQKLIDVEGEDSDVVRVRVLGRFPRAGAKQFIGLDLMQQAARAEPYASRTDPVIMGVDVAREGDDETVFYRRQGRDAQSRDLIAFHEADSYILERRIAGQAVEWGVDHLCIDGHGLGGPICDNVRRLVPNHIQVHEVKAGRVVPGSRDANMRATMYRRVKDALIAGLAIVDDPVLEAQGCAAEYGFKGQDLVLEIETKQHMKDVRKIGSPDRFEALLYTYWEDWEPKDFYADQHREAQRTQRGQWSPYSERQFPYQPKRTPGDDWDPIDMDLV